MLSDSKTALNHGRLPGSGILAIDFRGAREVESNLGPVGEASACGGKQQEVAPVAGEEPSTYYSRITLESLQLWKRFHFL